MEQKNNPGDSNRITREYFDSLLVEMRQLDSGIPSTELELYGERFSTPVMMAALSHLNSCHPDGMVEMARGAAAAGAVMWAGMGSGEELEAITATGAKTVKIVKPYEDRIQVFRKLEHAEACGALAVGMDIDHAFNRTGQYDNVLGNPMAAVTLEELKAFVRATGLPFIVKGVLSVQDARKCAEAGVRGIVVSHHHGVMDYAVPPLMVLPKIAEAVGKQMPIFADCGFESGMDVFKALALGATAVSVGRVVMGPLHDEGAEGIRKTVERVTGELAGAMARTASRSLREIDASVLWRR